MLGVGPWDAVEAPKPPWLIAGNRATDGDQGVSDILISSFMQSADWTKDWSWEMELSGFVAADSTAQYYFRIGAADNFNLAFFCGCDTTDGGDDQLGIDVYDNTGANAHFAGPIGGFHLNGSRHIVKLIRVGNLTQLFVDGVLKRHSTTATFDAFIASNLEMEKLNVAGSSQIFVHRIDITAHR